MKKLSSGLKNIRESIKDAWKIGVFLFGVVCVIKFLANHIVYEFYKMIKSNFCIEIPYIFLIVYAYVRIRSVTAYVTTWGVTMSSRPFLCTWNMYYYQQRCVYKISNQKIPHVNIITPIKSSIIYIHNRIVPPYMTFVVMTTYNHLFVRIYT